MCNDLEFYYRQAYQAKTEIRPHYATTLDYTDVFQTITDTNSPVLETRRSIDSDVLQAISGLKSYIMEAVFNRSDKWASVELNGDLFKLALSDEEQQNAEPTIREINKVLQEDTNHAFTYIQNSNYYTEISKSIQDLIVLGTGCYKLVETESVSEPFTFQYQSLDNLYIWEDTMSRPNIVFKEHFAVNKEYLTDNFGSALDLEGVFLTDPLTVSIDIMESVVPTYDEQRGITKYKHRVTTQGFTKILFEEVLDYNPFICFRWETIRKSPWGMGLGVSLIDTFKELKGYRRLRQSQAERIAKPPMNFTGNKEILYHLSNEPGAINWVGDGVMGQSDFRPSNTVSVDLMPLDKDIADLRARINSTFMTMPLGDVTDTKYTTALAVQLRHQEFRSRFSGTYELLNSELLTPTFIGPFVVLAKKGLLNTDTNNIEFTDITYVNELTKAADQKEIEEVINYGNIANQIIQLNQSGMLYKNEEVLASAEVKMGMNPQWLYSTQEKMEIQAQQQAMMQQAMMAEQGVDPNGQEVPTVTQ